MVMRWYGSVVAVLLTSSVLVAQPAGFNYDESKVPPYELPDSLLMLDGTRVQTARQWNEQRRGEVFKLFETEMYGRSPGRPDDLHFEILEMADDALGGKAIRKQVRVFFSAGTDGPSMDILIYHPRSLRPVPLFVGLNFGGNHTVHADPAIHITESWVRDRGAR